MDSNNSIKSRLARFIDVKSVVTLILAGVFSYLSVMGKISGQEFLTVFTVVISFYFGTQSQKNKEK